MKNLVKGLLAIGAVAGVTAYAVSKLKEKDIDKKENIEEKIDTVANKVDKAVKTTCEVVATIATVGFMVHTVTQLDALWDAVESLRVSDGLHFLQPKVTNENETKAIIEFMLEHANKIEDEQMRIANIEMIKSIIEEVK